MKTKRLLGLIASATLALSLLLSAASTAFAITSNVAADETSANGAGDTFIESEGLAPEYAGSVVDGILQAPTVEQTVIVVTQEVPAPQPAAAPAVTPLPAPVIQTPVKPATATPEVESPTPVPADDIPPPAPEESIALGEATQQVLGASITRDKLSAYYDDLRKGMDVMAESHKGMNNFLLTAMLVLAAVIPLQMFILVVQNRMEEVIVGKNKKKGKKRP